MTRPSKLEVKQWYAKTSNDIEQIQLVHLRFTEWPRRSALVAFQQPTPHLNHQVKCSTKQMEAPAAAFSTVYGIAQALNAERHSNRQNCPDIPTDKLLSISLSSQFIIQTRPCFFEKASTDRPFPQHSQRQNCPIGRICSSRADTCTDPACRMRN